MATKRKIDPVVAAKARLAKAELAERRTKAIAAAQDDLTRARKKLADARAMGRPLTAKWTINFAIWFAPRGRLGVLSIGRSMPRSRTARSPRFQVDPPPTGRPRPQRFHEAPTRPRRGAPLIRAPPMHPIPKRTIGVITLETDRVSILIRAADRDRAIALLHEAIKALSYNINPIPQIDLELLRD